MDNEGNQLGDKVMVFTNEPTIMDISQNIRTPDTMDDMSQMLLVDLLGEDEDEYRYTDDNGMIFEVMHGVTQLVDNACEEC